MKTDKALTETQLEQVETIRSSAGRLADLITNILKLNRLEKQTIQAEPVKYDVCEQLCDCVLQFENRWNEKEINLEAEIDDRAYIEADPGLMELVWNNLLSNALKFTEKGGTVHVSEHLQKDSIEIEVTDTGCGMTEETKNRIFEKFYQGDTSHATEGNGLGMALVFRILQISNGKIKVNSASGKGTTIIVTLNLSNKDRGE
jgi:signal transduction histidine kinase